MKPMSEERLREIETTASMIRGLQPELSAMLKDAAEAVRHYTTLPPDVAAAMERYSNRDELLRLESYYEYEADLDTFADYFTTLFTKGT